MEAVDTTLVEPEQAQAWAEEGGVGAGAAPGAGYDPGFGEYVVLDGELVEDGSTTGGSTTSAPGGDEGSWQAPDGQGPQVGLDGQQQRPGDGQQRGNPVVGPGMG